MVLEYSDTLGVIPSQSIHEKETLHSGSSVPGPDGILAGYHGGDLAEHLDYIVDSCPIILAKGPCSGRTRVCPSIVRAIVARISGRLPIPVSLMAFGPASLLSNKSWMTMPP